RRGAADQGARVPGAARRAVWGGHLTRLHRPGARRDHSRQRLHAHALDPWAPLLAAPALEEARRGRGERPASPPGTTCLKYTLQQKPRWAVWRSDGDHHGFRELRSTWKTSPVPVEAITDQLREGDQGQRLGPAGETAGQLGTDCPCRFLPCASIPYGDGRKTSH